MFLFATSLGARYCRSSTADAAVEGDALSGQIATAFRFLGAMCLTIHRFSHACLCTLEEVPETLVEELDKIRLATMYQMVDEVELEIGGQTARLAT